MLVKKELLSLSLLPIPKIKRSERTKYRYTAAADIAELPRSGNILIVDFYESNSGALKVRFFSDGKNFICCKQWLALDTTVWCKQNPRRILSEYVASCTEEDGEKVKVFLGAGRNWYCHGILGWIDAFCCDVQSEYRERQEHARRELQKKHFSMYPELPKDLPHYCDEHVFDHGYIFFAAKDKQGKRKGFCSECGKHFPIEKSIRSGRITFCPKCGKAVQYRAMWIKSDIVNRAKLCVTAKVDGQLLIRWMNVERCFVWPEFKKSYDFDDYAYNLHLNTPQGSKLYFYKWLKGPYCYGYDWYRGRIGDYCYDSTFVYTPNLDTVFGRNYYHVDMKAVLSDVDVQVPFAKLLNNLKNNPSAEYLFKLGMPSLAASANYIADPEQTAINSFSGVLGVNKQLLDLYSSMNVSLHEHRVIKAYGKWVSKQDLEDYRSLGDLSGTQDEVIQLLRTMSIGKFNRYFAKQKVANPKAKIKNIVIRYRDYIDMSVSLKVDLSHKSVRYPNNCLVAHDQILKRFNEVKHEIENEVFIEKVKPLYAGLSITEFEKDGFCIALPQLRSDLITEGQSLNHCVGGEGYYKNHIAGIKMIFFVRRINAQDKPFFTMEVDMRDFHICQLYGFGDCSAPKEVRRFAEAFVKKLATPAAVQRRTA